MSPTLSSSWGFPQPNCTLFGSRGDDVALRARCDGIALSGASAAGKRPFTTQVGSWQARDWDALASFDVFRKLIGGSNMRDTSRLCGSGSAQV